MGIRSCRSSDQTLCLLSPLPRIESQMLPWPAGPSMNYAPPTLLYLSEPIPCLPCLCIPSSAHLQPPWPACTCGACQACFGALVLPVPSPGTHSTESQDSPSGHLGLCSSIALSRRPFLTSLSTVGTPHTCMAPDILCPFQPLYFFSYHLFPLDVFYIFYYTFLCRAKI